MTTPIKRRRETDTLKTLILGISLLAIIGIMGVVLIAPVFGLQPAEPNVQITASSTLHDIGLIAIGAFGGGAAVAATAALRRKSDTPEMDPL